MKCCVCGLDINKPYKTFGDLNYCSHFCIKAGRLKEIFTSIIATGMHIGIDVDDVIEYAHALKEERYDDLQNTPQHEILKVIHELTCQTTLQDAPETITYNKIREEMGWEPTEKTSKSQLNKTIGFSLREILGLKVSRRRDGWVLLINDARNMRKMKIHYKKYRIG